MRTLPDKIFIAGTGTGIGKTITSAILAKAIGADYWKPIQCGDLDNSDTSIVKTLTGDSVKCHKETYRFTTASSPHYAAAVENKVISTDRLEIPETTRRLIIEAAGGLMVPLNNDYLTIDMIKHFNASVVLISKNYLGSINHTLLSIEALRNRKVDTLGVIFNGNSFLDNEKIIEHFTQIPVIGHIEWSNQINPDFIEWQAERLRNSLREFYEF